MWSTRADAIEVADNPTSRELIKPRRTVLRRREAFFVYWLTAVIAVDKPPVTSPELAENACQLNPSMQHYLIN
jgi:hypothetical protein